MKPKNSPSDERSANLLGAGATYTGNILKDLHLHLLVKNLDIFGVRT